MTKPIKLPEKLSALLRLAVKDVRKINKMKTRKLSMGIWHETVSPAVDWSEKSKICVVCMAGAVMDRTLQSNPNDTLDPHDFSPNIRDKLFMIDNMRIGKLDLNDIDGLELNPKQLTAILKFNKTIKRNFNRKLQHAPWWLYLRAANILEKCGL